MEDSRGGSIVASRDGEPGVWEKRDQAGKVNRKPDTAGRSSESLTRVGACRSVVLQDFSQLR